MSAGCARARGHTHTRTRARTSTVGVAALLVLAGVGSTAALAGTSQAAVAPSATQQARAAAEDSSAKSIGSVKAVSSITTDSGQPAISWTWTSIVPKPGEPRGYVLFQRDCWVCHGSGPAKPGTRALRAKYHGKLPALLEDRTDLTAAYVKYIVRHGVSVMPPFRKTEVSDTDLDAIAAYLARKRSAR